MDKKQEEREMKMFGCRADDLREAVRASRMRLTMYAISTLSDAQESMSHAYHPNDTERARQLINRAKLIIDEFLTPNPFASPVDDHIVIAGVYRAPDGVRTLSVTLGEDAFEGFQNLPDVITFEDRLYGKTGFNSDTGLGYYKDDMKLASVAPTRICDYEACDQDPITGSDFCEGHQRRGN